MKQDIDLKEGTRIYYGGDRANDEGWGIITKNYTDRWGHFVDIALDDGRKFPSIPITMFSPEYLGHGGTRFVREDAYDQWRKESLAKLREHMNSVKS